MREYNTMLYVDLDWASDELPEVHFKNGVAAGVEIEHPEGPTGFPVVRVWTYSTPEMEAVLIDYLEGSEDLDYWMEEYVMKGEMNVQNVKLLK